MWIGEDVVAPDDDFEQERIRLELEEMGYQEYRDSSDYVDEYSCPHCDENVFPMTGFIPPTGEDRVLSATAQYCPAYEAVLDITWGLTHSQQVHQYTLRSHGESGLTDSSGGLFRCWKPR